MRSESDSYIMQVQLPSENETFALLPPFYVIAKAAPHGLKLFKFPDPKDTTFVPDGVSADLAANSFNVSDLPHLVAAARAYESKGLLQPSGTFVIATTPAEIDALRAEVLAATPPPPLSLVQGTCASASDMTRQVASQGYVTLLQGYSISVLSNSAALRWRSADRQDPSQSFGQVMETDLYHYVHPDLMPEAMLNSVPGASDEEKLRLIRKFFAADIEDGTDDFGVQIVALAYSQNAKRALLIGQGLDFDNDYRFVPLPTACIEQVISDAKLYEFTAHGFTPPPNVTRPKANDCNILLQAYAYGVDCEDLDEREATLRSEDGGLFMQGYYGEADHSMGTVVTISVHQIVGQIITVFNDDESMLEKFVLLLPMPPATIKLLGSQPSK